jgi:hypothetical protein
MILIQRFPRDFHHRTRRWDRFIVSTIAVVCGRGGGMVCLHHKFQSSTKAHTTSSRSSPKSATLNTTAEIFIEGRGESKDILQLAVIIDLKHLHPLRHKNESKKFKMREGGREGGKEESS